VSTSPSSPPLSTLIKTVFKKILSLNTNNTKIPSKEPLFSAK
jgi:hypothetical protein